MHDKSSDWVVVVEIRLSEVDVSAVNDWVKVTVLVQNEIGLEVNLEVLEYQLDVAVVRQEPEVDILFSIYLPMFDCGEFDTHESLVERSGQLNLNICNVEVNVRPLDISPGYFPLKQVEEEAKLVVVRLW